MPRQLRDKAMTRVNLTIDKDSLSAAQRKAALAGVEPTIAGNASAFVRWLVDGYNKNMIISE